MIIIKTFAHVVFFVLSNPSCVCVCVFAEHMSFFTSHFDDSFFSSIFCVGFLFDRVYVYICIVACNVRFLSFGVVAVVLIE